MKIINRKKFIVRIIELFTIIGTLIITPIAINYATKLRGYIAQGGEYLIPILALLLIIVAETILEETIRLKDQEIYDVKTSVAEVLEEIHELNEKNEDEVLRRKIAELCTNTRYELLIDETKNRTTTADQSNK